MKKLREGGRYQRASARDAVLATQWGEPGASNEA
jgi:hypothetical protein